MRDGALTVIACGASAVLSLPDYLVHLRLAVGVPVRLLLTHSANRFVNPDGLGWHADEVFPADATDLNPTEVALRSRVVAVLPASANMVACAALGLAGSPAQTAVLAAAGPVLFFPSMNSAMWDRPVTRRHVSTLRGDGHVVVDPVARETYSLWRREVEPSIGLLPPQDVAKIIASALDEAADWSA